ncbi:uncharacterized protein THITE_2093298 [Thermothielavioides terrestris NRRL 8126]|uniref:Uncharacterized protein n=1 Tax=Thermothielavioides terrestris (strain ATCC 38088 / NRRL 8126) TaxID=578455 RepID=G2RG60_THETT|nr:uncharacterized protein THITE_2093298 [Thermothielavioides terrestris NRRL 8126]AEO71803.1 hypothetical protein THITE_2093298 [Thermothielavioides terrestris NRRL 8126]
MDTDLQLSGEGQSSETTTYALEQYLNSDGGVTERLLRGLNVGDIAGRTQAVMDAVDRLADRIAQPSQTPN